MRICVFLDPTHVLRWHMWLTAELKDSGHEVVMCQASDVRPWPLALRLTFFLEKLLYQLPVESACSFVDQDEAFFSKATCLAAYDVVINCAGHFNSLPPARRILTPVFNDTPSELGALEALLDGRDVTIGLLEGDSGGNAGYSGRVAIQNRKVFTRALNNVCSRAGDLILKALKTNSIMPDPTDAPARIRGGDVSGLLFSAAALRSIADRIAKKLITRLTHLASSGDSWNVGWRHVLDSNLIDFSGPQTKSYRLLRDDGRRYYADPALFWHRGNYYLFLEEYPLNTGKGVISVSKLGNDGNFVTPRIVIEEPTHLSYPMVFEDNGEIFMVPESAESGKVTLYRAIDFPFLWAPECSLIDNLAAYDPTIHRNADGYWMFLTTSRWQSASWDSLSIFHSDKLRGPWRPHSGNPIFIDARASRPAGAFFRMDGKLYRPAQDGAMEYGYAVMIYRIDTLTSEKFHQTPMGRIVATEPKEARGVHTYNLCGQLEVIDVSGKLNGASQTVIAYSQAPTDEKSSSGFSRSSIP